MDLFSSKNIEKTIDSTRKPVIVLIMNYIKQLQNTVEEQKREIAALRQGYQDLRVYLSLPKFAVDTYVNKNDIFLRIEESLTRANEAQDGYSENDYIAEMGFSSEEARAWRERKGI